MKDLHHVFDTRLQPENNNTIEIKGLNSEWDMCDVCVPTADYEIH